MKIPKGKLGWMAAAVLAVSLGSVKPAAAQNPSMSDDFKSMMTWMSQELAQGLAFNAGSTFDPPAEVHGYRLAPDLSLGIGSVPLDKKKFPTPRTQALKDRDTASIFPSKVLFPNLVMHLRAALPSRHDFSVRLTNMTTPSNYKISPGTTGNGQSNSFGFGVRKHFFGGEQPLLTIGANWNHIFGKFKFQTKFKVDQVQGFSADSDVFGTMEWAVNSFGLNAVASHTIGRWTPFAGLGYNYATGTVRARLEVLSNTPLISPIIGESSSHPEANQARLIFGTQATTKWAKLFANTEIKAVGAHAGESWIIHMGAMLPFRIGPKSRFGAKKKAGNSERLAEAAPRRGVLRTVLRTSPPVQVRPVQMDEPDENITDLIFIQ